MSDLASRFGLGLALFVLFDVVALTTEAPDGIKSIFFFGLALFVMFGGSDE